MTKISSKITILFCFLSIVFLSSISWAQSEILTEPSRSLTLHRNEKNQIIQIDFPLGQTIRYSYSESGDVVEKEMSGFLMDYKNNKIFTQKVSKSEVENFNYLILKDMSERTKSLPTLAQAIKRSYSNYIENMEIEKKNEKPLAEKEFIKKMFAIFSRYYQKQFKRNKINSSEASQLLVSLSNCTTYDACRDFLIRLKKIKFSRFPDSTEMLLNSDPSIEKKYKTFITSYQKCLPQTTLSNLKKLTEFKKIFLNKDPEYAGETTLTDSPENSYISLPGLLFEMMDATFQVGNRDRNTRYTYYSDQSYKESETINQDGSKFILDTIVHEYGHLLQYTKFFLHSSNVENSILSDLGNLTTHDTINSEEVDILRGADFNVNEETSDWLKQPTEVFTRMIESGASYFALDTIVSCLQ